MQLSSETIKALHIRPVYIYLKRDGFYLRKKMVKLQLKYKQNMQILRNVHHVCSWCNPNANSIVRIMSNTKSNK